ncbi:hypothetical protein M758_4G195400 [Ceratodon purpureus]|nr:hypothetical protein M758_4G195400 [Ceratodon purpureus]
MGNKITRRRAAIDERYTRPQGLYPCRDVDQRKLRRLILESKLAPCYPGAEDPATDLEECPICFLQYPSLNRSKCCTKGICTECFLQLKAPNTTRPTQCPFCKTPTYAVEYRGAKTLEEKGLEQAEEQKVIEAKIRMRQQELQDDEEREKRREEDIRLGRTRLRTPRAQLNNHPTSITPIDEPEDMNWRSSWANADRQEQARFAMPAFSERNTSGIDPYALWVDGDYQRAGGLDITAPFQQSPIPISSNFMPSMNQQETQIDFPTPRFPPGAPRSRHREDDFDLDLEDIMVMEAIWLSIQEQGARHRFADEEATRPSESLTEICLDSEADEDPPTGGLAGAIAALAERQAVRGNTAPASQSTIHCMLPLDPEVDDRADEVLEALENSGDEPQSHSHRDPEEPSQRAEETDMTETLASTSGREEEAEISSSRASEHLAHWVSSMQEEYRGSSHLRKSLGGRSSEQVEVDTSFASSIPSASEVTSESNPSDFRNGETSAHDEKVLLPDNFEEQMMLAMALSIADAQASRIHHGDTRSGPLPQPIQ